MGIPSKPETVAAIEQEVARQIQQRRLAAEEEIAGKGGGFTAIEDGTGSAFGVRVNGENNMGVEARHGRTDVTTTNLTVGTTSQQVVDAEDKRLQVTIQNLHDTNRLFIKLGGAATANQDLMLLPGAMYSLPPGVAWTGAIHAVGSAADTAVVVVEYAVQ